MEESERQKFLDFVKRATLLSVLFVVFFILSAPFVARAQGVPTVKTGIEFAQYTGLANTDVRIMVAKIIRAVLSVVGIIALLFTLYGGWMYMTSAGEAEKVKTAIAIIKNMIIGLIIILSALAIVQFVIIKLGGNGIGGTEQGGTGWDDNYIMSGYLGSVVESHYPARNAAGVARNTKIVITFRQKMLLPSLINDANHDGIYGSCDSTGCDQVNVDNLKIYASQDGEAKALTAVRAAISTDHRILVLKPQTNLGDGARDVRYTVKLNNGVMIDDGTAAGKRAFSGVISYYDWEFTVGTFVDETPPSVQSIIPLPKNSRYPRNIIVQVNFSEPVDPIAASGLYKTGGPYFQNILITSSTASGEVGVTGEVRIANQYRTVEFISDDRCGVNPCGQPIYCLPPLTALKVTVKSATLDTTQPPQALIRGALYDGVVDMADNVLNGGGEYQLQANGKYALVPGLSVESEWKSKTFGGFKPFFWSFTTSDQIDNTAPSLTEIHPQLQEQNVSAAAPNTFRFSKPMSMYSFRELLLKTDQQAVPWYTHAGRNYNAQGIDIATISPTQCVDNDSDSHSCATAYTTAELLHGSYAQPPSGAVTGAVYFPFAPSRVTDIFQNCFYQAVGPGDNCVVGAGLLGDTQPSCYGNVVTSSVSTCGKGEGQCPFTNPTPKP